MKAENKLRTPPRKYINNENIILMDDVESKVAVWWLLWAEIDWDYFFDYL